MHASNLHLHVYVALDSDLLTISPTELNLVDVLYQMLRDRDPQVVSNCVSALSEVLASEGGMVVNSKIAHYLLNRSAS
jgi:vesicle coat complex subunit